MVLAFKLQYPRCPLTQNFKFEYKKLEESQDPQPDKVLGSPCLCFLALDPL